MKEAFSYMKARVTERDSQVVLLSALYTIIRSFVPPEHQATVDAVAGVIGAAYVGTPIRKLK